MYEIWYDVQKISLEHDQCFFYSNAFFMKKTNDTIALIYAWSVNKGEIIRGQLLQKKWSVMCLDMGLSQAKNIVSTASSNGPLFLMEWQLAKPSLSGPGLTTTSPDNKIKLSWQRETILRCKTLRLYMKICIGNLG